MFTNFNTVQQDDNERGIGGERGRAGAVFGDAPGGTVANADAQSTVGREVDRVRRQQRPNIGPEGGQGERLGTGPMVLAATGTGRAGRRRSTRSDGRFTRTTDRTAQHWQTRLVSDRPHQHKSVQSTKSPIPFSKVSVDWLIVVYGSS